MRIGVLADTHDRMDTLRNALDQFEARGVEVVLHAGDYVAPFVSRACTGRPFSLWGVFGNNDGERVGLVKALGAVGAEIVGSWGEIELAGRKILVMHEPRELDAIAASGRFDLIVYGHTHEWDLREGKTTVLNPGEACGWLEGEATAAVVDLETMRVEKLVLSA